MSQAKATVTPTEAGLSFTFAHGSVVAVDFNAFPQEVLNKFLAYGIRQKLQDSYASKKESKEAEEALSAQLERLFAGEWTATRVGSGSASGTTKLVIALINVSGKTQAEVEALVAELSEDQLKALRNRPIVAAELARMRAEELAKKAQEAGEDKNPFGI